MNDPRAFEFPEWFKPENCSNKDIREIVALTRDIISKAIPDEIVSTCQMVIVPVSLPFCDIKMSFIPYKLLVSKAVVFPIFKVRIVSFKSVEAFSNSFFPGNSSCGSFVTPLVQNLLLRTAYQPLLKQRLLLHVLLKFPRFFFCLSYTQ